MTARTLLSGLLLAASAGTFGLSGCAYNATSAANIPTLIFEFSVEGDTLARGNNVAYYFTVNTDPDVTKGPLVNGPAPLTYPYPDPRSYLPFVRDESAFLDRQPIPVPPTNWTDFFALYEDAGQFVLWQGRKTVDPNGQPDQYGRPAYTVNERYRQLQENREWGIKNGKTVQITLPLNQFQFTPTPTQPYPTMLESNLSVATRAVGGGQGYLIERWGQVQNTFFTIDTSKSSTQNLYDTVGGVTFPQNLAGLDARSVNLVSVSYRVVANQ